MKKIPKDNKHLTRVPIEFADLFDEVKLKWWVNKYRRQLINSSTKIMVVVNIKCIDCMEPMRDMEFIGNFDGGKCCPKCNQIYSKYDITRKDYMYMRLKQRESCAICKTHEPKERGLFIDHCHKTGKVRGLLCGRCNSGIGFLKDNEEFMWSAIMYLKRHKANNSD